MCSLDLLASLYTLYLHQLFTIRLSNVDHNVKQYFRQQSDLEFKKYAIRKLAMERSGAAVGPDDNGSLQQTMASKRTAVAVSGIADDSGCSIRQS